MAAPVQEARRRLAAILAAGAAGSSRLMAEDQGALVPRSSGR